MAKYLVTGGSGFIGTNLIDYHLSRQDEIINFDTTSPRNAKHKGLHKAIDLLDKNALLAEINRFEPDYIYHLGARTDLDGLNVGDYLSNTLGLQNLVDCCDHLHNLKRVIFASSRLVCEIGHIPKDYSDYCPTTSYGDSKVAGENLIKGSPPKKWEWCIVRPTSIWGPWFSVPYRNFFNAVEKGLYFHPKNLEVRKSFGYVGNTVYQLERLMHAPREKVNLKTFYLADYEPIEVMTFANQIAREFKVRKPISLPLFLLKVGAKIGDIFSFIGLPSPLTSFRLNNLVTPMIYDLNDLKSVVGPLPYKTVEGIIQTVAWMRAN